MFETVKLEEGTSAEEVGEAVINRLEKEVPIKMMMQAQTDGAPVMIGLISGALEYIRKKVPTLPSWGGCPDHDLSNLLKHGVKALMPNLTKIYAALFGCLNKHSMHKKRDFERMEEWAGPEIKKVPKFLDVRFRVLVRCARWMESQDRALYEYFTELKEKVLKGKYEASETEMIVIENYLGHYLEVRLSNRFLIDVSKPVIEVLDYFESSTVSSV